MSRYDEMETFRNWIDTGVLADHVFEHMEEVVGVKPTFKNAQKVWLDFLETELHEGVENSVDALVERGELDV